MKINISQSSSLFESRTSNLSKMQLPPMTSVKALDYGKLYKNIQASLENPIFTNTARQIAVRVVETMERPGIIATAEVHLPKAVLRAEGGVEYILKQRSESTVPVITRDETLCVHGIKCACIVGVNPHERKEKRVVVVDLKFSENFKFVLDRVPFEIPANPIEQALEHSHEIIDGVVKVSCMIFYCLLPGCVSILRGNSSEHSETNRS